MSRQHKFATRLSRKLVLGTSIIFVVSLIVLAIFSMDITQRASVKYATELLHAAINEIEAPISHAERMTAGVSRTMEEENHSGVQLDTANYFHLLESGTSGNPHLVGFGVFYEPYRYDSKNAKTGIYVSRNPVTGKSERDWDNDTEGDFIETDYRALDWYKVAKDSGKGVWFPPYFDKTDNSDSLLLVTYSHPMKDDKGEVFGVCTSDLSLEWIRNKLESLKPYENSNIIIADQDLNYICNPIAENPFQGTMYDTPFIPGMSKTLTESDTAGALLDEMDQSGSILFKSDGKYAFCVYGIMSNGWIMSVITLYNDTFRDLISLIILILLITLAGLVILYFSTRLTIKKQTEPLGSFSEAASRITDGHFDVPIPEVRTGDEIEDLGEALKYMQVSVTDYIDRLETTTAEKERLSSELKLSHGIQMEMLSSDFPKFAHGGIYASCTPAREVGGDLYDFVANDKETFFILGDVSGKGVPAALLMAITIAAFRTIPKHAHTMANMVYHINRTFCHSNKDMMFVTLVLGRIDRLTGEVSFCNAGHNPMVYISPEGKAEFVKARPNLACGIMDRFSYEGDTLTMAPGSRLLIYSDGLTEAERADKAQYGEDRLLAWVSSTSPTLSDEQFVKALASEVHSFTAGNEPNDDMTIMSVSI